MCKLIVLLLNELAADGLQPAVDEPGAGGALQLPLRHPGGLARLIQVTLAKLLIFLSKIVLEGQNKTKSTSTKKNPHTGETLNLLKCADSSTNRKRMKQI